MMSFRKLVNVALAVSFLTSLSTAARADEWKKELSRKIKDMYVLTKSGGWGGSDKNRIKEAGTVLVIQTDGVSGDKATDMTYTPTKVRDGKVSQTSSFLNDKKNQHTFKPGDRVYLTDIDVKDDEVWYWIVSCDTFSVNQRGSTQESRYKGVVIFQFPKGHLETASLDEIKGVVGIVFLREDQVKAASTKTIELNQTFEQVEAVLGKPDKIIKLGDKTVYVYKDMKITFLNGKVADVQ